jgi:flavin-dependent dehydrogenase
MALASVDVLVAGAGPGGVAAALTAARRGLEVVLLDRARFAPDKPCAEGVVPSAVDGMERLRVVGAAR